MSLLETPVRGKIYAILEAHGWSDWLLGPVLGQGGRQVGQTGGEILSAHVYHNDEERWCRLLQGSVLFRLVAPPLQSRVVGPYPIWVYGSPAICC
jgi:hypothetical protein